MLLENTSKSPDATLKLLSIKMTVLLYVMVTHSYRMGIENEASMVFVIHRHFS